MSNDIKEQTRFSLEGIKLTLEAATTSLDNVLTNTCYIGHGEDCRGSMR